MLARNSGGRAEIRKTFKYFDRDASGQVTYPEFLEVLRHENMRLNDRQAKELMAKYDLNGMCLSLPAFMALCRFLF